MAILSGFSRVPTLVKSTPSALSHIASGICGSLIAEQILFPFDTVKIHAQTSGTDVSGDFLVVAMRIFREGGVAGFYRGLAGALFKEAFHSANFWVWHALIVRKAVLRNAGSTNLLVRNLVYKQLDCLCTTPLEVLSSLNQMTPGNPGLLAVARRLFSEGGIAALYRGLPISLALAINPAIMMLLIHKQLELLAFLKRRYVGEDKEAAKKHGPGALFYATAIAKVIATAFTYPLIRAKVLMQMDGGGILDALAVLSRLVAQEGYGGLYKGVFAMTWKTVLHNALMMTMKHFLSPVTPQTPPPSPRQASLLKPLVQFGRNVGNVETVMAEKLDQIIANLANYPQSQENELLQRRVRRVELAVEGVRDNLSNMGSDMRQVKDVLLTMHAQKEVQPNRNQ